MSITKLSFLLTLAVSFCTAATPQIKSNLFFPLEVSATTGQTQILAITRINGQLAFREHFDVAAGADLTNLSLFKANPAVAANLKTLAAGNAIIDMAFVINGAQIVEAGFDSLLQESPGLPGVGATRAGFSKAGRDLMTSAAAASSGCMNQCDDEWDDCIGPNGGQDPWDVAYCDAEWEYCVCHCDSRYCN